MAQLLSHCGQEITRGVLGGWAVHGRVEELVVLSFYLGNACATKDTTKDASGTEGTDENIRFTKLSNNVPIFTKLIS